MHGRLLTGLAAAAALGLAGCGGKGAGASAQSYTIGGTVAGLTGTGLVLQNGGGDDLPVAPGASAFVFATPVPRGGGYAVTVRTRPTNPGQTCTVAGGTGTAVADVSSVAVTCTTDTFTLGGAVAGLTAGGLVLHSSVGAGEDLTVPAGATRYVFAGGATPGTAYTVGIKAQPAGLFCTLATSSGTVGSANVTNLDVTCSVVIQRWAAPTTWGGLWPATPTMVQHAHFDGTGIVEDPVTGIGWSVAGGSPPPQREFKGFPSGSRFGAGPFTGQRYEAGAGTDGAIDALTGDMLVCAVLKPDYNPTSVVPGGDDFERPIIARGVGHDTNAVPGGGWVLMQMHSYFCFHYEYLDASGVTHLQMAIVPTYFADRNSLPHNGPLNPSYVVFCGGRAGNTIHSAVNQIGGGPISSALMDLGAGQIVLDKGVHRTTIGGYDDTALDQANHVFGGRIYETAIWNEPATPANIQAKLAAIQGLDAGASYLRNREAWFVGADGADHAAWWNGPRIDRDRGFLFGLQGWNRLSSWAAGPMIDLVTAPGEDMGLWTPAAGAIVEAVGSIEPPGDSERASAKRVTLPPGGTLTTPLGAFDADGPIHGQLWLRVPPGTTGILTLAKSNPAPGGSGTFDIDLSTIPANTWTRIWLRRGSGGTGNELTTDGTASSLTLQAAATNAGNVSFYAWGIDLTQLGTLPSGNGGTGGVDLGSFDPGQAMYDWGAANATNGATVSYPVDALQLPPVPVSTAGAGFCLAVDAATPAGLPWSAPFTRPRTAAVWVDDPRASSPASSAMIYADASRVTPTPGQLCFKVTGAAPLCAPMPASFTPGSSHGIMGCMSAAGDLSLYADGSTAPIASAPAGIPALDLSGGSLLVGGARTESLFESNPWHGFVSKAVVCYSGDVAGCR